MRQWYGWMAWSTMSAPTGTMDKIGPYKDCQVKSNPWWFRVSTQSFWVVVSSDYGTPRWRCLLYLESSTGRFFATSFGTVKKPVSREAHATFGGPQRYIAGDLLWFFSLLPCVALWFPCDKGDSSCIMQDGEDFFFFLQVVPCLIKALAISLGPITLVRERVSVASKHVLLIYPKNPDPSKVVILRTNTPLRHTGSNPSIGGSNDS